MSDYVQSLKKAEIEELDAALPRTIQIWSCDPVLCETAHFIPVFIQRARVIKRVTWCQEN